MNHFSDGTYGSAVKEHTLFDQSQSAIEKRFFKFHDENPYVYEAFRIIAIELILRGQRHYGAKAIFEIMRYKSLVTTGEKYKLNNDYTAYYARMFEDRHPDYVGFFEMRTQKE